MTIKPKVILCFFAHPDDESFGPGGSIAHWISQGAMVHIVCATKGGVGGHVAVRAKELKCAAKILGVSSVTFLKYKDGQIGNNALIPLEKECIQQIEKYKPDTLLTYDLNGVSGHMDHIAVASATTQAFKKSKSPEQLVYYTIPKAKSNLMGSYFIHFPDGKERNQVDLIIDVSHVWNQKVTAMKQHNSQMHDVKRILLQSVFFPKEEWFTVRTTK
jgi:LmbE family N-acetylglucosaminyl deacetylase